MIATKTGVRDSDYSNTQYFPIFRVKNLPNSKARLHTTAFINFTVWWESRTAYTKKTYSTNATLHSANSTNTYNCILVDETPGNADFEVVALSDGSLNGYTTYYINAPTDSAYSGVPAQIVINKCDLLPSIEFLGGRPFDIDVSGYKLITDTSTTEEETEAEKTEEKLIRATSPIDTTSVKIGRSTGSNFFLANQNHSNKAVIKEDGSLYIDYGIYANTSATASNTNALAFSGIKPTEELQIISPYGYLENTGGGICKFILNTDGTIDVENASPKMVTRLILTLERYQYTFV